MNDRKLGYIFHTGTPGADSLPFQQLVTIDAPTAGDVIHYCVGRQGVYYLSEVLAYGRYSYYTHVLPSPGGTTDVQYERAKKQTYRWKSKKFALSGRTTFAAARVKKDSGEVRLRLHLDGKCRYDAKVRTCDPFRLPDQIAGTELEIELIGTATVYNVHIGTTLEEVINDE